MKELEKYFDHYVISARIKPIFFVLLPVVLAVLITEPSVQTWGATILTFLVTFGVISFLSNTVSIAGNDAQTKLFEKWGGAPTTRFLRHSDTYLDEFTKKRYHSWLSKNIDGLTLPTPEDESQDKEKADKIYQSSANYLLEKTRDISKYHLLYKDLVNYGFVRNLFALRWWGVSSSLLAMGIFSTDIGASISEVFNNSLLPLLGVIIAAIMLTIFIFVVDEGLVKSRAERYAKSLLACCDLIE
ncbi:MAG: hypothetical protein AB2825_10430 [Candidatus Thiodiazotropha endolucinida]